MGGHVILLGLQEFPREFAGGLAMCAAGPGEMDFLTAVAAASVPSASDIARAEAFAREPFLHEGETATDALAPGTPRRMALDALAPRVVAHAGPRAGAQRG